MSRRRKAPLPEDMALWEHVKEGVQPLKKERLPAPRTMDDMLGVEEEKAAKPTPAPKLRKPPKLPSYSPPQSQPAQSHPPLAPIEPSFRRALRRGNEAIEGRLDLHGLTLEQAQGVLHGFLMRSKGEGKRLVLVITGKGREEGQGVLKRAVPQWLAAPALRSVVLGFEASARHHGGSGALYVRLRRTRDGQ